MALLEPESFPDTESRRQCDCEDCRAIRAALALLDTIADSSTWMPSVEIDMLCKVRELLAHTVGAWYDLSADRYRFTHGF